MVTGDIVAGKIVPKSLLVKQNQREKMAQEISLHRKLSHSYVVKVSAIQCRLKFGNQANMRDIRLLILQYEFGDKFCPQKYC